jgi:cell wall-associated NlpC family hydrolase
MLVADPARAQDPADIEAEIDDAWDKLRPVIEEHNATRIELKKKRKAADALEEKIKPLEEELAAAREEVAGVAVQSFKSGNMSAINALLTTGSPLTFADQLSALDQFAKSQRGKVDRALEAKEAYEVEMADLDGLIDELAEMEDDLAERTEKIDAEIEELEERYDEALADQSATTTGDDGGSGTSSGSGSCPVSDPGGAAGTAVNFACAQVGKPYGFGQAGPGAYDCSGLTSAAWAEGGVSLPHNAAQQRDTVASVDRSDLRPGDLVFYYSDLSHVAMYIGGNQIVQASNPNSPLNVAPIDQQPIHSYGRP